MPSIFFNRHRYLAILAIVSVFGSVTTLGLFAEETTKSNDRNPSKNANPSWNDSDNTQPHPWLASVPPSLARLVESGSVQLIVDQRAVDAANRTALTIFTFTLKYQMRFRMQEQPKDAKGNRQVRISAIFYDVETRMHHRIVLSERFRPARPWETPLLQHEFDHVAISTDPRMFAMLKSFDGKKITLTSTLDAGTKPSESWAKAEIEKSITDFRLAVEKLVQQYYVRLDEVSKNGIALIDDRARFFQELYSSDDLQRMQFPYVTEVSSRLKAIDRQEIKQHYLLP